MDLFQFIDWCAEMDLAGVELTSREVRPGDLFGITLKFRNEGTQPARSDYMVFLHFEAPEKA